MTKTMTPAQVAQRLRTAADMLDLVTEPVPVSASLNLNVCRYFSGLPEHERIAAVDALTSVFGLNAAESGGSTLWQYSARQEEGAFTLSVRTYIDPPPVCACGQACTHRDRSAVPA